MKVLFGLLTQCFSWKSKEKPSYKSPGLRTFMKQGRWHCWVTLTSLLLKPVWVCRVMRRLNWPNFLWKHGLRCRLPLRILGSVSKYGLVSTPLLLRFSIIRRDNPFHISVIRHNALLKIVCHTNLRLIPQRMKTWNSSCGKLLLNVFLVAQVT